MYVGLIDWFCFDLCFFVLTLDAITLNLLPLYYYHIQALWGSDGPPRRCCLVRAKPRTGRWHQIRQHLGRENHPILGETQHHPDKKENKAWREHLSHHPQRLCLHSHRLQILPSPDTGTEDDKEYKFLPLNGLDISCPLPNDMQSIIGLTDWANDAWNALPELFEPYPEDVLASRDGGVP
jgi:hypothetical protein